MNSANAKSGGVSGLVAAGIASRLYDHRSIQFARLIAGTYSSRTISAPLRENRASQVSFDKSSFKLVTEPSNMATTVFPL